VAPCLTAGVELTVDAGDAALPATLDLPAGPVRGAVAALHGAQAGARSYFCYAHLARALPSLGVAVLRYDRRPGLPRRDVPLDTQARDAAAAVRLLRRRLGPVRVGLWGFSQGAWAAPLAAARYPGLVDFLVLVSSCGVSPARQMRFGTAAQLRQRGFTGADQAELAELRTALEEYQRGGVDRATAQVVVDRFAGRPWFPLAYVPRELSGRPGTWTDLDFDPAPVFAQVRCPVLLYYGETDGWVPVAESVAVWRAAAAGAGTSLTIRRLAGCDHLPTVGGREELDAVSPAYTATLLAWLDAHLPGGGVR